MAPDLADPGDADGATAQRGLAPRGLGRGAHPLEHAVRGQHGAVAGAAVGHGPAGDEARLARDQVHVGAVGAHVAGRVVAAAERLDNPAVGAQQGLGLVATGVADDDGLAAAEVEPRQRGLVGHAAGEGQRVGHGLGARGVRVEARAAEGGAEGGGVDRDDGAEPRVAVVADHDLLVVGGEVEDVGRGRRGGGLSVHGCSGVVTAAGGRWSVVGGPRGCATSHPG